MRLRKIDMLWIVATIAAFSFGGGRFKKELYYDRYTLKDVYKYNKIDREFQWGKMAVLTDSLTSFVKRNIMFATLTNYKNRNGLADMVKNSSKDRFGVVRDEFGTPRHQAIPLYDRNDDVSPLRYATDGSFVAILSIENNFYVVEHLDFGGEWRVPKKFVKPLLTSEFQKVIVIDRNNQNIATLENSDNQWYIRSMNPATTGENRPPYKRRTPLGSYVLQGKLSKMFYYVDGTTKIGGYAPFASRFSGGAYIHGVPIDLPRTEIIEYSRTLGSTPRSHMCVRNATSHAKYIFDWAETNRTLIYVIE